MVFLFIYKKPLVLLNVTSCYLSLNITVFVAWHSIGLNLISNQQKTICWNKWSCIQSNFSKTWYPSKFSTWLTFVLDIYQWSKSCYKVHLVDDTNLLHFSKSINKFNKYINLDMKNLSDWLNANKIALNVKKTKLVIFKHKKKN